MTDYRITLVGYHPEKDPEPIKTDDGKSMHRYEKGGFFGSTIRFVKADILEDAIEQARDVWKEWIKENSGSMIEIWIQPDGVYPPRVGTNDALFYKNNFIKFKPGSKRAEGTPF